MKACFTLNKLQQEAIVKFVESLENIGDRKLDVESLNHAIEVATKPGS